VIKHFAAIAALMALFSFIGLRHADGGPDGAKPAGGKKAGDASKILDSLSDSARVDTGDPSAEELETDLVQEQNAASAGKPEGPAASRTDDRLGQDRALIEADIERFKKDYAAGKRDAAQKDLDQLIQHRRQYYADFAQAEEEAQTKASRDRGTTAASTGPADLFGH
jgi:hypothetical protein